MKDNKYFLNTALAVILGIILVVCVLVRTFAPSIIMPQLSVPNIMVVSLLALLVDHYAAPNAGRCYICVALLSAVTFGLLPFAGGFITVKEMIKAALVGGAVFTVATLLYTSVQDRLSSGPVAKAAPVISAIGLYLAAQCFAGMV